ncbi:MAG: c-type cytochrome [Acidobacteriota bacterium]
MTFSSRFQSCLLVLAVAVPLVAQSPPSGRARTRSPFLISRPVPDPAAVDRGKALFGPSCGFCHGTNATGAEGPDLVRSAVALRDEGGDEIGPVIRAGRPGMPAFPQMTDAQIKDIAAFIRNRQQDAIDRGSYTLKNVNTGDAKRGETYFAAHCATCHTGSKDLKGVAAKYDEATLMGKIVYPGGRGPAVRPTATVTAAGKTTSGVLEYHDDFEVGLRLASGEYRGFTLGPGITVRVKDPLQGHVQLMKTFNDKDLHDVLAYLESMK